MAIAKAAPPISTIDHFGLKICTKFRKLETKRHQIIFNSSALAAQLHLVRIHCNALSYLSACFNPLMSSSFSARWALPLPKRVRECEMAQLKGRNCNPELWQIMRFIWLMDRPAPSPRLSMPPFATLFRSPLLAIKHFDRVAFIFCSLSRHKLH